MQAQVTFRYSSDECAKAAQLPPLPAVAVVTAHVPPVRERLALRPPVRRNAGRGQR